MHKRIVALVLVGWVLALAGCGGLPYAPASNPTAGPASAVSIDTADPLLVAAASDLQFAFGEIAALYKQQTGQTVVVTFGSTGTLAQQIENGAPFDLFAAADVSYIEALKAKALVIPDSQQLYAQGRIVLAVNKKFAAGAGLAPAPSPLQAQTLAAAVSSAAIRQIAIANPDHAPYGKAALQALQAAGVWEQVKPELVYGENVSQALQYVQSGNADIGIVALSVANVPELSWTLLDAGLHQPLNQMVAVLKQTKQAAAARAFIAFVNGPQGRPIMKRYGFALPGEL